jgi:peptide/nickel transport system permease protein
VSANPVAIGGAKVPSGRAAGKRARGWVRYALRHKVILVGAAILMLAAIAAVFGPVLAPYGLDEQVGPVYGSPSWSHPLGLDDGGIDMVTLLLYGARTSMLVGVSAALVAMLVGGVIGVVAGYRAGRIDTLLMRVTDYFIVVPAIPLMIAVAAVWGASLLHIILVIGLLSWPRTARLLRAQAKTLRERGYVKRVRSLGGGHARVLRHHVLPHLAPLLIASTVLTVAEAVFAEAALAFLGLGSPTDPSWGTQIANAFDRTAISAGAWWAIIPPGVCITLVVIACSAIGLSVEDALNPRLTSVSLSRATFRFRPSEKEKG